VRMLDKQQTVAAFPALPLGHELLLDAICLPPT
jgi:hypothetical protein